MSEIIVQSSGENLEHLAKRASHILIVEKGRPKEVVIKEIVFPKETHFEKKMESSYTEYVEIYHIKKIIKSEKIKSGEVRVWTAPAYDEASSRAYHEEGLSESPIVREYHANSPNELGDERILFLADSIDHSDYFLFLGAEGLKSQAQIEKALALKK